MTYLISTVHIKLKGSPKENVERLFKKYNEFSKKEQNLNFLIAIEKEYKNLILIFNQMYLTKAINWKIKYTIRFV